MSGKFVFPKDGDATGNQTEDPENRTADNVSFFAHINNIEQSGELKSLLKRWNLDKGKLFFVFVAHEDEAQDLWDVLMQTAKKAKVYGQEIIYVFIAPLGWPSVKSCIRLDGINCIRVYCRRDNFKLAGDIHIDSDNMNNDSLPNDSLEQLNERNWFHKALHRACSHYLFTKSSVEDFVKTATQLEQHHPLVVIYGDVHHFKSHYKSFVFNLPGRKIFKEIFLLCGIWDRTGWDERIRFLHFPSLLPDVFLLQILKYLTIPDGDVALVAGRITKVGTLFSRELTLLAENEASQNIQFCKKYCVLDLEPGAKEAIKKQLFWDDLPDYNHVICMVLTRDKTSKIPIDRNVFETINGLRGLPPPTKGVKPMYVVFDPQGLSFNIKTTLKPLKWMQKDKARCLAFVPMSHLNPQLGDWDKNKGQSEIFPMQDWNGCVDTYIFVKGEVLSGTESFSDAFYKQMEAYLTGIIPKSRGIQAKILWLNFKSSLYKTGVFIQSFPPKSSENEDEYDTDDLLPNKNKNENDFVVAIDPYKKDAIPVIQDIIRLTIAQVLNNPSDKKSHKTRMRASLHPMIDVSKHLTLKFEKDVTATIFRLKLCLSLITSHNNSTDSMKLRQLYRCFANIFHSMKLRDKNIPKFQRGLMADLVSEISENPFPKQVRHPQIKEVLSKTFKSQSESLLTKKMLDETDYNETAALEPHAVTDLYFAAVIGGNCIATEELLPYTKPNEIVANALYAVGVFHNELLDAQPESPIAASEEERERFEMATEQLEKHAKEIVHQTYSLSKAASRGILFDEKPRFGGNTAFDLACMAQTRSFLSDKACTTAIKDFFWQDYGNCSLLKLLFFVIFPCLTPAYVSKERKSFNKSDESVSEWKDIYGVPAVKCLLHFLVFMIHVLLYSYLALTQFGYDISVIEYVILVWMVMLFVREVVQFQEALGLSQGLSFKQKFQKHFARFWNVLDLMIMGLYFIGLALRVCALTMEYDDLLTASQVIFAFNAFPMYVRTAHFYSMHEKIGPLLIAVRYMFGDLMNFVVILFVILFGYGIALQGILFPHSPFDFMLINDIMHVPYFQIYGEPFEEYVGEANLPVINGTQADPGFRNYFGLFLTGFYLLFTNILLLNLLIALFNSSYLRVEKDSIYHNIIHKVEFIREFDEEFILPPPFNILVYIAQVVCIPCRWLRNDTKVEDLDTTVNVTIITVKPANQAPEGDSKRKSPETSDKSTQDVKTSELGKDEFPLETLINDYFRKQLERQEDRKENDVQSMKTKSELKQIKETCSEQSLEIKKLQNQNNEIMKLLKSLKTCK